MKYYDYLVCIWFAYALTSAIFSDNFLNCIIQLLCFYLYEDSRKTQEISNV